MLFGKKSLTSISFFLIHFFFSFTYLHSIEFEISRDKNAEMVKYTFLGNEILQKFTHAEITHYMVC